MFGSSFTDQVNKKQTYNGFYVIIQNENELANLTKKEVLPAHDKLGTKIQISIHEPADIKNKTLKICSQQQIVKIDRKETSDHSHDNCRYVTNSEHEISLEENVSLRK